VTSVQRKHLFLFAGIYALVMLLQCSSAVMIVYFELPVCLRLHVFGHGVEAFAAETIQTKRTQCEFDSPYRIDSN